MSEFDPNSLSKLVFRGDFRSIPPRLFGYDRFFISVPIPKSRKELFDRLERGGWSVAVGAWRLERGVERVLATVEGLSEEQLFDVGVFEWAEKWPVARWISINTSTQYVSARTSIRRALKA